MYPDENGRLFTESIEEGIDDLVAKIQGVIHHADADTLRVKIRNAVAKEIL